MTVDTDTVWHSAGHQLGEPATGFASPVEERASMAAATRRAFKDISLIVYREMMYMNERTQVNGCELKGRTENEDRLFRIE